MKRNVVGYLCLTFICLCLFTLKTNAGFKYKKTKQVGNKNTSFLSGWKHIENNWYYFDSKGNKTINENCDFSPQTGSYVNVDNNSIEYNNKFYFFDKNGRMLHDCFIIQGSGCYQYWLDSNGEITDKEYGNKYLGRYDLSKADFSYVPCLNGYSKPEAEQIASKAYLKLNIQYVNIPDKNLNNIVLAQDLINEKITKNVTTSTLLIGKYDNSSKQMTTEQIRDTMAVLYEKYDAKYSWLYLYGLY